MKTWITLFTILFSLTTFAQNTKESTTFSSPDRPIIVSASNPSFTLHLKSNPTTGFFWYLGKYDDYQVSATDHEYLTPEDKKMVGAPGQETWTFNLQKSAFNVPRIFKIHFTYARPWTTANATDVTFTILTRR